MSVISPLPLFAALLTIQRILQAAGGWYNFSLLLLAFGLIPLLDLIVRTDNRNPSKEQEKVFASLLA